MTSGWLAAVGPRMLWALAVMASVVLPPAIARTQSVDADRLALENAEAFYLAREYEHALDKLERLLLVPDLTDGIRRDATAFEARCYVRLGRHDAACDAFLRVLALDASWQPDTDLYPADEVEVFARARALYSEQVRLLGLPPCPSSKAPMIASGVFVAAAASYLLARRSATDRWDKYTAAPDHSADLYEDYESAYDKQELTGGLTIASGVVAGVLWFKHVRNSRNCRAEIPDGVQLDLRVGYGRIAMAGRF